MKTLRLCFLSWILLLSACATAPLLPTSGALFHDALFQPLATAIAPADVFAMTPEMQRYADTTLKPAMRQGHAEQALIEALYAEGQLQLEYDASITRTAADAFAARTGNCLSLVIMTGAFANYLGLPVRYQEVLVADSWSRSGGLAMANGHVNLRLSRQSGAPRVYLGERADDDQALTVDFLPSLQAQRYRVRAISQDTIVAMYINNRAAELLAAGQIDAAYWWAREGIRSVPAYLSTYNTLGVIYQQHGNFAEAETVLRQVLALEPENTLAMGNLVGVLKALGRADEAQQLAARLATIEPYPPYHFFDLGIAALKAGDFKAARSLFQREIKRAAYEPEAHFWLAIANAYLGEPRKAEKHLQLAIDNSTTVSARALYSAKLDWLKAQGYQPARHGAHL